MKALISLILLPMLLVAQVDISSVPTSKVLLELEDLHQMQFNRASELESLRFADLEAAYYAQNIYGTLKYVKDKESALFLSIISGVVLAAGISSVEMALPAVALGGFGGLFVIILNLKALKSLKKSFAKPQEHHESGYTLHY